MTDVLKRGSAWLDKMRKSHASSSVVFCRGANEVPVSATIGRSEFDVAQADGVFVRVQSNDFLVTPADLAISGNPITPAKGDRIKQTIDGKLLTFEVISPDENSPPWRYSDGHRTTYRIHSKLIKTEDV